MTDFEKRVYNTYLKTVRSNQNLPFKLRKDFSKFEESSDYPTLKKICKILQSKSWINIDEYFNAPYKVNDDNEHLPLKFFSTIRAIKLYSIYKQETKDNNLDSDSNIKQIVSSLKFIQSFCNDNNIHSIIDYLKYHPSDMSVPAFIMHIKEESVFLPVLFGEIHFETYLYQTEKDILKFILHDKFTEINDLRRAYLTSKKAKNLIKKGIKVVENHLKSTR